MFSSQMRGALGAAFILLASAGASQASQIINISALTPLGAGGGMAVAIAGGEYRVDWIGTAGGGLYDAAYTNGCTPSCNWTEGVRVADGSGFFPFNGTVNFFGSGSFSSAAAALSAIQAGPIGHSAVEFTNGVAGSPELLPSITVPFVVDIAGGTYNFAIPDGDGSTLNNFGGVSLELTPVPEPATWLMMLLGFGGLGWMLRRKGLVAAH